MTIENAIDILAASRITCVGVGTDIHIGAAFRWNEAVDMAVAALRAQQEVERNEPLTVDELHEMGGQPYYHVSLQGGKNHWTILDPLMARYIEDYHYGERWLAYRLPPAMEWIR